jgi:hypothetical protein
VLVAVAGLDVIGAPLSEELVFGSEMASQLMDLAEGETITNSALARLFAAPAWCLQGRTAPGPALHFLKKTGTPLRRAAGAGIAAQLRRQADPVAAAVIAGHALDVIRIHGEYRLGKLP